MILIGASVLTDFGATHKAALPALQALNALLRQAAWPDHAAIERDCGAIAQIEPDGRVLLTLAEAGCRVALRVNTRLGVVRIVEVTGLKEG